METNTGEVSQLAEESEVEVDIVVEVRYQVTWRCLSCDNAQHTHASKTNPPKSKRRAMFCVTCKMRQEHELLISDDMIEQAVAWGMRRIRSKILPLVFEQKELAKVAAQPPINIVIAASVKEREYHRYFIKK